MSRGTFHSHNKDNKVVTFYTNSNSGTTFDPAIFRYNPQKRFHWDLGFNYPTIALTAETLTYTYQDSGIIKKVRLVGDTLDDIYLILMNNDSITGSIDISQLKNLTSLDFSSNPQLTGVTYPISNSAVNVSQCGILGNHDVSNVTLNGAFVINGNSNLTGITHSISTNNINSYTAFNCDLTGNHDVSMFPNLGSTFRVDGNPNLTSITHTASTNNFFTYWAYNCNLTGTHDMSMLTGLGGSFIISNNNALTKIIHTASTQTLQYIANSCDLTGNHDVSMFPNLGGVFQLSSNQNLTGITHTTSTQPYILYDVGNCNLTGTHDMSMLTGLGGIFQVSNNPLLTTILHTGSTQIFSIYAANVCGLTGTHDMSMLTGLGGILTLYINNNLTSVLFPNTTQTFKNTGLSAPSSAFGMYSCSLDYVDFKPLSGITMDVNSTFGATINLSNNLISTGDINHILYDFSGITTNNLNRWSGVTLDISGNSAPDSSTGGYDGISSINYLTGATANWTIIL